MENRNEEQFIRTKMLLGEEAIYNLHNSRVAVFGIGGVGGFVVEGLVRAGIEHFDLIDNDTVDISNLNRQIIASYDTLGEYKTKVMKQRILSINPQAIVHTHNCFFLPENKKEFDFSSYDYVIDAIDTVTGKIAIIEESTIAKTPIISCMGTGNKLDPSQLVLTTIAQTSICPLAKVMRRELKKRGIVNTKVLYSKELARKPLFSPNTSSNNTQGKRQKSTPGSISFVPSVAGLMIAGEVIRSLSNV